MAAAQRAVPLPVNSSRTTRPADRVGDLGPSPESSKATLRAAVGRILDPLALTPEVDRATASAVRVFAGNLYLEHRVFDGAIEEYSAAVGISDAPVGQVARARLGRGFAYGETGQPDKAVAEFTAVEHLAGTPTELVAQAARAINGQRRALAVSWIAKGKAVADGIADAAYKPMAYYFIAVAKPRRGTWPGPRTTADGIADAFGKADAYVGIAAAQGKARDVAGALATADVIGAPLRRRRRTATSRGPS